MEHLYGFQVTRGSSESYRYKYLGKNAIEAFEDMVNSGAVYLPKGFSSVIATRLDKVHAVSIKFEVFA